MKSMTIEQAEKLITPGGKWVMLDIRRGDHSRDIVSLLQDHGIDAANLDGGWRAYLRLSLQRFMEEDQDEKRSEKTAAIERSIIKRFRKTVWSPFTKAVKDYQLIQEGDRIACCISGGKDSFLMAKLLQELQMHESRVQ